MLSNERCRRTRSTRRCPPLPPCLLLLAPPGQPQDGYNCCGNPQQPFGPCTALAAVPWPTRPAAAGAGAGGRGGRTAPNGCSASPAGRSSHAATSAAPAQPAAPVSSSDPTAGVPHAQEPAAAAPPAAAAGCCGFRLLSGHAGGLLVLWGTAGGRLRPMCVIGEACGAPVRYAGSLGLCLLLVAGLLTLHGCTAFPRAAPVCVAQSRAS